jgi:hypothetical protein
VLHYQPLTADQGQKDPKAAVAQIANTVARPGPLTTEWWTVLVAGAVSSVLALGLHATTARVSRVASGAPMARGLGRGSD